EQVLVLPPQLKAGDALALLDDVGRGIDGPGPDEEVDVVGLDRQLQDRPPLLSALVLDQLAAVPGNLADQHRLAALRAPDAVVDDEMDAVFVPLVLHTLIVDNNATIDNVERTAKANNRLTSGAEAPRLAAG